MPITTDVKLSTLGYVILYVKDTEKAKAFYRDVLGLKLKVDHDGWVELDTGTTTLALHGTDDLPEKRLGQPIVVFNVPDIYAAYESLKSRGVKFESEPQKVCQEGDQIGKSADFEDPYGNRLSIFGLVKQ